MAVPSTSTWEVDQWKFNTREQIEALTDAELLAEWKELAAAIRIFFKYRVSMTMEMSWMFSNLVDVMNKRSIKTDLL